MTDVAFNRFLNALPNDLCVGFVCGAVVTLTVVWTLGEFKSALGILRDIFAARRAERDRKERECQENRKRFAELRRTKRAEQEKAEADAMKLKRRKDADEAELVAMKNAMSGIYRNSQGLLLDSSGNIYCPQCMKGAVRSAAEKNQIGDIYCPRCGWNCPVYFTQIIR